MRFGPNWAVRFVVLGVIAVMLGAVSVAQGGAPEGRLSGAADRFAGSEFSGVSCGSSRRCISLYPLPPG
jgi:hypothetical protein